MFLDRAVKFGETSAMDWPLRCGVFMAPFHPVRQNVTLALERDLQLIEHLDRLGFHEAWIGEHHSAGYEIIASPEVFIAAAAERTKHIRLGTGVVSLPYHHPLMLADRFVLLAPSGCGKSTLLKAVGGYMHPTEGEIRLKGREVIQPGPDRMMVFQEFDQLLPWKTVKENVVPQRAEAKVNFRLLPGDTPDQVVSRIKALVDDPNIEISYDEWEQLPGVADHKGGGFAVISSAVTSVYPEAVVVPSLLVATTDTRHYIDLADNQYRFHGVMIATGLVASFSSPNSASTAPAHGGWLIGGMAGRSSASTSSRSMSSGMASTTGPGRPLVATRYARATYSGMRAASSIRVAHLASGPKNAGKSTS